MQHKVRLTVIDKKLYPELQAQYCAEPNVGACPCYNVGDEFIFERYGATDDFWHMGFNTLKQTEHVSDAASNGGAFTHCAEAWAAVSRYIYTGLQGGSIMRTWMNDEKVMIACCSDGTRPVIFKIERIDYKIAYIKGVETEEDKNQIKAALKYIDEITDVVFRSEFTEIFVDADINDEMLKNVIETCGDYTVDKID